MKTINKSYIILFFIPILFLTNCNKPITDFGYDGSIFGKVVDQNGNIVAGDITSAAFSVHALGENDDVTMVMRVKGDGTFANTKLYPQSYEVWLEGPITSNEQITIDLTGGKTVEKDFVVTPCLSLTTPVIASEPTPTEVGISYKITENSGFVADKKEIYCSTVPYPTSSTGSGPYYETLKVDLTNLEGTINITGLSENTKYFIRVGALASGESTYNYSDQVVIKTP